MKLSCKTYCWGGRDGSRQGRADPPLPFHRPPSQLETKVKRTKTSFFSWLWLRVKVLEADFFHPSFKCDLRGVPGTDGGLVIPVWPDIWSTRQSLEETFVTRHMFYHYLFDQTFDQVDICLTKNLIDQTFVSPNICLTRHLINKTFVWPNIC